MDQKPDLVLNQTGDQTDTTLVKGGIPTLDIDGYPPQTREIVCVIERRDGG